MRVSFVQLGVCEGSGTSRRSGQDARERCLGAGRSSGSGLLRQTVSGAESKKRVASHGKLVGSEWVCHFHQVFFMEMVSLVLGSFRKRDLHVFDQPRGCLLSDFHSPELSTISLDCSQGKGPNSSRLWVFTF